MSGERMNGRDGRREEALQERARRCAGAVHGGVLARENRPAPHGLGWFCHQSSAGFDWFFFFCFTEYRERIAGMNLQFLGYVFSLLLQQECITVSTVCSLLTAKPSL
jgi:hypothetical protein